MFELGNISEFICFTTGPCCIYKWQDIERLRGGSETCVEIEQDLFLEVLFLFFVENYDILDFGLINYVQNERKVHDITAKIIACKFNEEWKHIFQGARVRKFLSPEQWKQRCQDLLLTFFSRDGKDSGIITFPETTFTAQGKP